MMTGHEARIRLGVLEEIVLFVPFQTEARTKLIAMIGELKRVINGGTPNKKKKTFTRRKKGGGRK